MQLFNTLNRKKEEFEPLDPAEVRLYCCGPTVYHYAHIGNLRTYLFEDWLRRTLEWNGYTVRHVMNITDVGHLTSDEDAGEDKMLKGARREKKTVWEVAEFYAQAFLEDMDRLNCLPPHLKPKATDHIAEMIKQIRQLEENGFTYTANGNVYFDTSQCSDYGKLAQLEKQELKAGARVEVDTGKKNPHDFALWFTKSKFGEQDMRWESPWGKGYPGWHIECSAMSMKYLGDRIDIHCGGIDHIPVHHTNELAQAEGATGKKPWVNYWLHGNFLTLGKQEKMAKSGENFLTLKTLTDHGYSSLDYRYFCLQAHYRKELTFSWEGMEAAKTSLRRLREKMRELGDSDGAVNQHYADEFESAINDDLNLPQALSVLWKLMDDKVISSADKRATAKAFDTVLGLKLDEPIDYQLPATVQQLMIERDEARRVKDWKKSDELRIEIEKAGFVVKDTSAGTQIEPS